MPVDDLGRLEQEIPQPVTFVHGHI